MGGSEETIH